MGSEAAISIQRIAIVRELYYEIPWSMAEMMPNWNTTIIRFYPTGKVHDHDVDWIDTDSGFKDLSSGTILMGARKER